MAFIGPWEGLGRASQSSQLSERGSRHDFSRPQRFVGATEYAERWYDTSISASLVSMAAVAASMRRGRGGRVPPQEASRPRRSPPGRPGPPRSSQPSEGKTKSTRLPVQYATGKETEWAGIPVDGPASRWLQSQKAMSGVFDPSPIQAEAIPRIYSGESCCIQAPTGTGKTLCYLLPMLQRFREKATSTRGLRFLILVPTAALQTQTAALARALLGPGLAENVSSMRRDVDNSSTPSNIVVATPRQIQELLDTPLTQATWRRAIGYLDMVVVDEADRLVNKWTMHQRRVRFLEQKVDPAVIVLKAIEFQTTKAGRRDDWQLVAASATMSRRTHRNLKFSAGIDLTLIRAPGSDHWEAADKPNLGQYGDGTTNWPAGLRHRCRVPNPFRFPKVMSVAAQTIAELPEKTRRVLVVLATTPEKGRAPKSIYGLNLVLGQLNFRLAEYGRYEVLTCNEAIDNAATLWAPEGAEKRLQPAGRCQVVVASCEAIRGIHLDNIDAVVLVGDPMSVGDYQHCAGRTCRYQPGSSEPVEGMVVSIVPDQAATRMLHWGNLSGFKLVEVPLNKHLTTGERLKNRNDRELEELSAEELSEDELFVDEFMRASEAQLDDLERRM